jgi:spermidine dehydrogenase
MVIPYLCPDLPAEQKDALHYGVKVPLVYSVVGLRNWAAFHKLGLRGVSCPGMYHTSMNLDQAANIGDYKPPESPDEPILVHMLRTPCQPGLSAREQQLAGHYELLATPFETFERNIRDQLVRVLGSGGFDPARDIEAITVNRWPHGYAYEYNPLWDPDCAISHDNASGGLPSRTPMPPLPPIPTRRSIKAIELCRSCCRAKAATRRRQK